LGQDASQRRAHGRPLDQAKQVLLRYVDECVAEVKVSSPVFSAARAALGDENLATVTLLVGHYMMTAQFLVSRDSVQFTLC